LSLAKTYRAIHGPANEMPVEETRKLTEGAEKCDRQAETAIPL
jgi:hypothetical protein